VADWRYRSNRVGSDSPYLNVYVTSDQGRASVEEVSDEDAQLDRKARRLLLGALIVLIGSWARSCSKTLAPLGGIEEALRIGATLFASSSIPKKQKNINIMGLRRRSSSCHPEWSERSRRKHVTGTLRRKES
jgi:hypothetical protein